MEIFHHLQNNHFADELVVVSIWETGREKILAMKRLGYLVPRLVQLYPV